MEVQSTQALSPSAGGATSETRLFGDYTTFLQLLTTQLKNQDPLSPLDATEWVSQLSQFAVVEQSVQMNRQLEAMTQALRASSLMADVNLAGKQVMVPGNSVAMNGGPTTFAYSLETAAAGAAAVVTDAAGTVVATFPVAATAGQHEIAWNGLDAAGQAVPPGLYSIDIAALDAAGKPVDAATQVIARVQRVELRDGHTTIVLDNQTRVSVDAVQAVLG